MGVIFSWLYNQTKGSVLLAVLLHDGMNFTLGFLSTYVIKNQELLTIQVGLIIVLAIILSHKNKQGVINRSTNNNFNLGSSGLQNARALP